MQSFLGSAHSGWRWIVLLSAAFATVWLGLTLVGALKNARVERVVILIYAIALDVMWLLGLLHFIERLTVNGFYAELLIHLAVGLIALGFMHAMIRRARKQDGMARTRLNFLAVIVPLVLVFFGVAVLVGGLGRWF
ncbi:MAG: hypothetical protein OHK0023_10760 [Anaerolineae bacterium]